MSHFINEYAEWIGDNVAGIDLWNKATQTGNLFINFYPAERTGTICVLSQTGTDPFTIPYAHGVTLEFLCEGETSQDLAQAAWDWIVTRNKTADIPEPFDLVNWHVETGRPETSTIKFDGMTDNSKPVYSFEFSVRYRPLVLVPINNPR